MSEKGIPLAFYRPPKKFAEVSDAELRAFSRAYWQGLAMRYVEAATPDRVDRRAGTDRTEPEENGGRSLPGKAMDYARILARLQSWARIRVEADGNAEIIGPAIGHSALLRRMLADGKDPLPLPPPKFLRRPWYALIEERGAVVDPAHVRVAADTITIGRDGGWRILETVVPGSRFVVTHRGRAIGRWRLVRAGEGDDAAWQLARIPIGPGTDWEHHVAHVARRLARLFADPERHEFVIVEGGVGYVQVCPFGRRWYLDFEPALRYEAAGDENVSDPETTARGLGDRLRAVGFQAPDEDAEGNYLREGPAPVDVRALAEDMLVVLAEAYGLTPTDPVRVKGAVGRDTVSRGRP